MSIDQLHLVNPELGLGGAGEHKHIDNPCGKVSIFDRFPRVITYFY